MKRKFSYLKTAVCLAVAILLFAGYSMQKIKTVQLDPKNPIAIELWHYYNGPQKIAFDQMVSEFNETIGLKKGIIVEAFGQGNITDLQSKIMDAVNKKVGAQEIPNMFSAYTDTAYSIDKTGFVADLSSYITSDEQNEYVDCYIEEGRLGNTKEFKIFPIAKSTEFMMINKTDWDKFAGATHAKTESLKTWEGIASTAKAYYDWTDSLTPLPNDGRAFFGRDAMANYILVGSKQLGVDLIDVKDGKISLHADETAIHRLWDNFYIPYVNGYYVAYGRFRSDDAKTGDIIAWVGSTSGAAYFPSSVTRGDAPSYNIESMTFPLPNFKNTEPYAVQQGAGIVVIKSDEMHEYACVEFLKWLTEAERNIKFATESGYMPVKKAANNLTLIKKKLNENSGAKIIDQLRLSLPVAIEQVQNYTLYTPQAFENGADVRDILNNSLLDKCKADRETVVKLIGQGMSHGDAVKKVATEENFRQWLIGFKASLEDAAYHKTVNKKR